MKISACWIAKNEAANIKLSIESLIDITDEIIIKGKEDYSQLIPSDLPEQFTAKDYKKESGLYLNQAQTALNVLYTIGAVARVGKVGNAFLYEKIVQKY